MNTKRNYCREMAIMHAYKVYKHNGQTNEDLLTGSVYHIMFVNYFTETYIFEAINAVKASSMYKQEVKQLTKKIELLANKQNDTMASRLGEYADRFADVNLVFDEHFSDKMDKLNLSIQKVIKEHTDRSDKDVAVMSRVVIAAMLALFAARNVTDRINECKAANPIVLQMNWSKHDIISKLLATLCSKLGVPGQAATDLTINSKLYNIEKLWHTPEFLASILPKGLEEIEELSEIYSQQH